ncbi:MAG: Crp/Fnr family transcriptional regulator [Anaerolineae bacterium]|nr:Crp/Fnr family transcriptional regulator [Anaerolineae bacterium]
MLTLGQIRKYSLFTDLNEDELARLAPCLIKRAYAKGVYLFYPGTSGLNTYLVESGLVRLFFTNAVGQEFLINLVGPGEVFGYPILAADALRIMGAATYKPSVILSISHNDLLTVMESSPRLMRNVYSELSAGSRKLLLYTRSLVIVNLEGRLAIRLLHLLGKSKNQTETIEIPLSQTEFASWLGASRGRLNHAMNQLQKMGVIRVEGRKITILNRSGLERLAEGQGLT